jgi:hypothetical protein
MNFRILASLRQACDADHVKATFGALASRHAHIRFRITGRSACAQFQLGLAH